MLSRQIQLNDSVSQSNDLDRRLSDSSKSWLLLFVCCDIPAQLDDTLINCCTQYLTPRQRNALTHFRHEHLQVYNSLRTDRLIKSSAEPDQTSLIVDIQRTACFIASIEDTFGTEFKAENPCPIRWSILLNSFLRTAWTDIRFIGPSIVEFQCYPSWSMHRSVKSNAIDDEPPIPHQQIVPDAAFIVKPDFVFGDAAFSDYDYDDQFQFSNELSVAANPAIYTGTTMHSEVPVVIVEYVKSYGPQGRKWHLVHLSMAMKSAMGLLRALALPPIVLGLLVDGFRTTVVCCSGSEDEDLVTELPEMYDFNLVEPIDVFRLRRCIRNVWKLAHEIESSDRAAHVEVEKSISSESFPLWKVEADRHVGSNQTKDTVRDWCDDVASKAPPSLHPDVPLPIQAGLIQFPIFVDSNS
ncbi:hypothetical protein ARMSODRAFT_26073 [Armillaria solidipes]|uniref:Uncharacterized protein n=1 Tax=Armillaria solidipes TaxID=1076256 RepID=A0A2H3CS66_9AGAR|nr:hypothetical protein ARMSODRAFT_26073 [Armillaria solidipes]